jgi:methyl coenzyme M reductase alpha subunit
MTDKHKQKESVSIGNVLDARKGYGDYEKNAVIMQGMKDAMRSHDEWDMLDDPTKEALEMIVHKVGRIVGGDPYYVDSWVDIQGYAQLIINKINKDTDGTHN